MFTLASHFPPNGASAASRSASANGLIKTLAYVSVAATALWMATPGAHAEPASATASVVAVSANDHGYGGEFSVSVQKSQVLRVNQSYKDLLVGDPEIADVIPLTDRTVYVLGKSVGSTSLSIYGENRTLIGVVDVNVTHDVRGLKRRLRELMPTEYISVRDVGGAITLSGQVEDASIAARAVQLAERYAPDAVNNLISIKGSQQVMLAVRFAEVKRSAAKQFGFNTDVAFDDGSASASIISGLFDPTTFANSAAGFAAGNFTVDFFLDAMEEKGIATTLAEPNLIALSGETASFLAGGEFPIPVAANFDDDATITIEFKQFGVSLAFTPTVLGGDVVNLLVAPEVSALDEEAGVQLNGVTVPGLLTRRAETTVELRHGQSFAIAGLIMSDFADNVDQFPGLADTPVLGSLLRSADFQRNETELVIIITPYLVKPANDGELALPTDNVHRPNEYELFFLGHVESRIRKLNSGTYTDAGFQVGGLDGQIGHIVP